MNTEVWKPDNSYLLKLMNHDISNVGKITAQNILKKYREKKNIGKSS